MSLKEVNVSNKVRVLYLTKCCRRYPLKFGSKVAGWYSTVASVLSILNGFHNLASVTSYNEYPEVAVDLMKLKILFCLLDTAFGVTLLMGLYLERTNYLLSWIVSKSILLLCEVPLYVLMSYFDKLCAELGLFLFCMGIDIYCVLVVHGYFMELTNFSESEV
ncbi:uncharacterized protein LOC124360434 [Homalodisca vitripennis]|nr:uncharacterized protein LOC124360356 [Homalodisca vitripennis]XP_046669865.1 uncharacterized protein LOC124360356 [Homalodisca vitripennis]XP_046669866.1 uncharacterized protein LOC124360356 [Homalodisca vitripennis]XP_046670023.1 uncharacterized protein LOC124360434 [Homalodisca vitripennis]